MPTLHDVAGPSMSLSPADAQSPTCRLKGELQHLSSFCGRLMAKMPMHLRSRAEPLFGQMRTFSESVLLEPNTFVGQLFNDDMLARLTVIERRIESASRQPTAMYSVARAADCVVSAPMPPNAFVGEVALFSAVMGLPPIMLRIIDGKDICFERPDVHGCAQHYADDLLRLGDVAPWMLDPAVVRYALTTHPWPDDADSRRNDRNFFERARFISTLASFSIERQLALFDSAHQLGRRIAQQDQVFFPSICEGPAWRQRIEQMTYAAFCALSMMLRVDTKPQAAVRLLLRERKWLRAPVWPSYWVSVLSDVPYQRWTLRIQTATRQTNANFRSYLRQDFVASERLRRRYETDFLLALHTTDAHPSSSLDV